MIVAGEERTVKRIVMRAIGMIAAGTGVSLLMVARTNAQNSIPLTFLDTLNKGREVCLTDADLSALGAHSSAERSAVAGHPQESGVVPSRFKIQVLSTETEDEAVTGKKNLEGKTDLPLSITFETPFFKLFAGDFGSRDSAEKYLVKLRALGYGDAWVARKSSARP